MLLIINPSGNLQLEQTPDTPPSLNKSASQRIHKAFETSTNDGLKELVSKSLKLKLPETLTYWQDLARLCINRWARSLKPQEIPTWEKTSRMEWLLSYPPGPGLSLIHI